MPTWNELFATGRRVAKSPQREVLDFALRVENAFPERPLRIWDLCCGAGRHTRALAAMGHDVYASDNAPAGLDLTRALLEKHKLAAHVTLADMTVCPWADVRFHGAFCWDALHHNRLAAIAKAVATVRERLLPGGLFMATIISTKSVSFGRGQELEPGTFVRDDGHESGVPHHFFDEGAIRALFASWEIVILVDRVMSYLERDPATPGDGLFGHTNWGVLTRRPRRS